MILEENRGPEVYLVERFICNEEAGGSTPPGSTSFVLSEAKSPYTGTTPPGFTKFAEREYIRIAQELVCILAQDAN